MNAVFSIRRRRRTLIVVLSLVLMGVGLVLGCRHWILANAYDPDFYSKNYQVEGDLIYAVNPDGGERYPTMRFFKEDFESAASIRDLIGPGRKWTAFTLQSPKTPTIKDYNRLRHQILGGAGDFLDNRLEPTTSRAHGGKQSLRALAVAPSGSIVCSKASLHTSLMHFVKGDEVWFSAWYYLEKAPSFITLMDLETTFAKEHPGMRIRLNGDYLDMEFKWHPKPVYPQTVTPRKAFSVGRWVHVKTCMRLSDEKDGRIRLWQDGQLIVDQRGPTLPFAKAVYNDLEIGLSANSGKQTGILYVDDVVISADPIE